MRLDEHLELCKGHLETIEEQLSSWKTGQRHLGRDEMRDLVIEWLAFKNPELRDQFLEDFPNTDLRHSQDVD